MADITNALNDFKTAVNGEAVRDSFVATINLVNDDNIAIQNKLNAIGVGDGVTPTFGSAAQTGISDTANNYVSSNVEGALGEIGTKFAEIASGANNYVHPGEHTPSIITQDVNNRFVTDAQITSWTGKQSALGFTPENSANKGKANGYAELGTDGKVPSTQLPVIPEGHTHTNKTIIDKITAGAEASYDLDAFVTDAELIALGAGDMLKSVYDTTNNGVVDNSEKVNGLTVQTAVPNDAVFTDTVYTHPSYTSYASGLYKITTNSLGHVSSATAVAKADITGLGIPASDTTYSVVTTSVNGLMSSADKTKMDAISGSNTGDETSATIKTKLGISTISGSNTGDQTLGSFGITSTAEELNALDGITSTVAELNYVSGVTSAIQTQLNAKAASSDLLLLELSKLSSYSTNMDANGIYTNVEWKRANETTYAKSTLTGTSPNYSQVKVDYYDAAGTTIANTITWNISYNANNFSYQKAVI